MGQEYLELLKKLLQAEGNDAQQICDKILNTPLELPHFLESLVSIFEAYYAGVAIDYCSHKSRYNRQRLERVILEIED